MTDGGEGTDDFRHDGVIGVLLGADLLQVHTRPQKDPRRDELHGVVAAYARAQCALDVVEGLQ